MKHEKDSNRWNWVGQVQIAFTKKCLTSWGGVCAILARFFEQIKLREWVEHSIPLTERSPNAKGIYPKVLSLIMTSVLGGTRFSDLPSWMHGDEAIANCFAVKWLPRSSSTLTRLLGKFTQSHVESLRPLCCRLARLLIEEEKLTEDDLVFDSTVCTRYGKQDGALKGYNPHKRGRASHHPLKASVGQGYVVNMCNRSGNTHTAHQIALFFDQTCRDLPDTMKIRRVLADSGFCEEGFLEHLEAGSHSYIVAMRMSDFVKAGILHVEKWEAVGPGIEMGEAQVRLSTWKRSRRMVFVRQHVPTRPEATGKQPTLFADLPEHKDYRYGAMVTNDETLPPVCVWRAYRPRANIENIIKELKGGYGWDDFNVNGFWGTEACMLLIGMVAYNLIHYLNRNVLKTEKEPVFRLKKIRLKVLAIPAQYGSGGRRPTLRLGVSNKKTRARIRYWLKQICRLKLRLFNCIALDSPTPAWA